MTTPTDTRHARNHHETDHDHDHPHAHHPCLPETHRTTIPATTRYFTHCATHHAGHTAPFPTADEAQTHHRCDLDRRWAFTVIHLDDHDTPEILNLSGVHERVHDLATGNACCHDIGIYRLNTHDGTNTPLTLTITDTDTGSHILLRADTPPTDPTDHPTHTHPADPYTRDGITYLDEHIVHDH